MQLRVASSLLPLFFPACQLVAQATPTIRIAPSSRKWLRTRATTIPRCARRRKAWRLSCRSALKQRRVLPCFLGSSGTGLADSDR